MKPVTVRASTYGDVTEQQQEGLDRIVDYLTEALTPGPPWLGFTALPFTGRIVIEWGNEDALAKLRED